MALTEIGARLRLANAAGFKKDADKAAGSLGKLGREAGQADRKVTGLERASKRAGGALGKMGKAAAVGLAGLAAGGAAAGVAVLSDSIGKAADLGETMSKVNNVFGKGATDIRVWSKTAARSFGLSQQEALAAAGQYGDMFKQLGFTEQAAVANSKALVKMSADLGSFHNVDPTDVLDRIGAAMRGEYDSLQALIPNINAARVETEALAKTGKKAVKELTAQEKVAATLAIIHKDGALAADDFAETSGGLTNQQRILRAQLDDTKASIGRGLLPVMTDLAAWVNDEAVPAIQRFVDQFQRGVGPGGEFKSTLQDVADATQDVYEKTKAVVEFVVRNKDAFTAITAGVVAYRAAMKSAAVWSATMGTNGPKAAAGITAAGGAADANATKVGAFAAAAGRAAGAIGLLAGALIILDEYADIEVGGKGTLDKIGKGLKNKDAGAVWNAVWGEGFKVNPAITDAIRPDGGWYFGAPDAPPPKSRPGGSSQDRSTVLTPVTPTYPRKAANGNLTAAPAATVTRTTVVVPVQLNGREIGRAVIEDLEDRGARQ